MGVELINKILNFWGKSAVVCESLDGMGGFRESVGSFRSGCYNVDP